MQVIIWLTTLPQDYEHRVTEVVPYFNQQNRIEIFKLGYSMNVDCDGSYISRSIKIVMN